MSTDVNEVVSTEQTGVTINVNVPNKQEIEKTVVKKWRGDENALGNRPNTITVELVKNGKTVDEQILSKDNNWTYTWKKLNKYENAKEINYTIKEISKINGYDTPSEYLYSTDPTTEISVDEFIKQARGKVNQNLS